MVLPNVPSYSETFLESLINGLIQKGNEVIVLARNRDRVVTAYPVFKPYTVTGNSLLVSIKVVIVVIRLFLARHSVVLNYLKLVNNDGIRGKNALNHLYLNSHILSKSLDWLYFGFATMTLRREQVAKAIGAKMMMSIRCYDISITPLGNNNYYYFTWKYLDKFHYLSGDLF